MSGRRRAATHVAAVVAAVVGSAVPSVGQSPAPQSLAAQSPDRIDASGSNLFAVLAQTQDTVPMRATRVLTAFTSDHKAVRLVEKFEANNDGRFRQELERIDGEFNADERRLIEKAHDLRAGAMKLWRQFHVHDAGAATRNYRVVPMGAVSKLGRKLRVFDIYPRLRNASFFRILVDDEFQVVLDQVRLDNRARARSILAYSKLEIGPSVVFTTDRPWWTSFNKIDSFASVEQASAKLGFTPVIPGNARLFGFSLSSIESVTHDSLGAAFLKLGFTDGLDMRYLLERPLSTKQARAKVKFDSATAPIVRRLRQLEATQYFTTHRGRELIYVTTNAPEKGLPPLFGAVLR